MNSTILLISFLIGAAPADGRINPLFETDSIAAYNRWLWQHRSEYPAFRPTRAHATVITGSSGWTRPAVTFLTDSGTVLSRYVFPDSWDDRRMVQRQVSDCHATEDGDYVAVYLRGSSAARYTAFDRFGRKLFESKYEVFPRFNRWFRDTEGPESTQVLDDSGKVVGVLPRAYARTANSSGDTLFAVLTARGAMVFDSRMRVVWQSRPLGAPRAAAISPDGWKIAIVTRDSVGVHDLATGRAKGQGMDPPTAARYGQFSVAWSDDGRLLAVYRSENAVPDSGLLWILTRDGAWAAPARRLETNYARSLFWMGDTVVLAASPYLPNTRERIRGKPLQTGPCRVIAATLSGKIRSWIVPGRFGEHGRWHQQGRRLGYVGFHTAVFQVPVQ